MTTLTITDTHEAGTLIKGTSKATVPQTSSGASDGAGGAASPPGASRAAATTSRTGTRLSTEYRPTAEVEADKIARQSDRVDVLEAKADRKADDDAAAWQHVAVAMARLPEGGQPIHVGHHSEGRHRNAIKKADIAMRRSLEATRDAEHARGEAEAAAMTADSRYRAVTIAHRIKTLSAEIRKLEHRIVEPRYDAERGYVPATAEQIEAARARLSPYVDEERDRVAYWEGVRADQIESGTATGYRRDTVKKGDRVKAHGAWYPVVRVNARTVNVQTPHSWTRTVP